MSEAKNTNLVRGIRRGDLVALIFNGIVGAGIFGLPSKVFAEVNSYSLLAFLGCGILVGLIILCFAEVSSRFTETGGPYLYSERAFGPVVGFSVGWLLWLARVAAFAAILNLLIEYLGFFFPDVESAFWRPVIVTAMVVALTIINLIGVRDSAITSNIFAIGKLIPLLLFVVIGLFFVDTGNFSFEKAPTFQSFSSSMMMLIFAFTGFEVSTISAGEVENPRRNFPIAMLIAVSSIVVLYLLIQTVCIGTLPTLADSERPILDAAQEFAGRVGAVVIVVGAILSMTGTLNATLLGCTRIPFALAERCQAPSFFAVVHRRFHTPWISILVSSSVLLAFTLASTFLAAVIASAMIKLLTFIAVCASLPVFRRRDMDRPASFTVPGGTIVSVFAIFLSGWLILSRTWIELMQVGIAMAAGLGLYGIYWFCSTRMRKDRSVVNYYEDDPNP